MKVCVKAIMPEGMDIEETLKVSDLGLETEEAHYCDAVNVKAHLERDKDIVSAKCDIETVKTQVCSRCLAEFEVPIKKSADFIYEITGEHTITLDGNIKDTLILEDPMKILCKEDCKGLCVICGKNLNYGLCDCSKK